MFYINALITLKMKTNDLKFLLVQNCKKHNGFNYECSIHVYMIYGSY